MHPNDSIGFLRVTVKVLNVADPVDDSTDLFEAMCRITTLFVLLSHMMNISMLASNIKLEHFIELSSSEFPQLVLENFAFPSIFEFSYIFFLFIF